MKISELSPAAREILAAEEKENMAIVNKLRYLTVVVLGLPTVITSAQSGFLIGMVVNIGALVGYLGITILHTLVIRSGDHRRLRMFNYLSAAGDISLILVIILFWGLFLSPHDFTFAAKTPAWNYIGLMIVVSVLQYNDRVVYLALGIFLFSYLAVITTMYVQGTHLTNNWLEYVNGPKIDFADLTLIKPLIVSVISLVIATSIRKSLRLISKISAAESKRALLARYFSPAVVEDITSDTGEVAKARRQKVTILFLDIRNFTRISEKLAADVLVNWLSDFRARLTGLVFRHGGSVDKFIGDAILATFGTPKPSPIAGEDSRRAVSCALAMLSELEGLNRDWAAHGIENAIGIGIHTGEVFAGNIGDSDQIEYTVIGDAVNTASRIESLCKKLHRPLVISAAVAGELTPDFATEKLPSVKVKGKEEALKLFTVTAGPVVKP